MIMISSCLPSLLLVSRPVDIPENVRQDSICPVSCGRVKNPIQFNHTHSFRVQRVNLCQQSQPGDKARKAILK